MDTTFPTRIDSPCHVTPRTLNIYFTVTWVCLVVGYLLMLPAGFFLAVINFFIPATQNSTVVLLFFGSILLALIGFVALIAMIVFWAMLHYQLWKLIPKDIARITPGIAVGLLFIPFFNFYWVFVSCLGLCKSMNLALQQCCVQHRVSELLALVYCILCIVCSTIPVVAWFLLFGSILEFIVVFVNMTVIVVVFICFYKSVVDGAIALIEQSKV